MSEAGHAKPERRTADPKQPKLLIVLKGYPRVSETFIAQELLGLQDVGFTFEIVSLRRPYDAFHHPVHEMIKAPVLYLPEKLREEPAKVASAFVKALGNPRMPKVFLQFLFDLVRDKTRLRIRCFGQALVLAAERPSESLWLYSHFAHSPTSVVKYAARLMDAPFSISAHAKDIWTSPDWELREKLKAAKWTVTCTLVGQKRLMTLAPDAPVHLCYHGLDSRRFPQVDRANSKRCGDNPDDPVRLISVGRAVPKKGYDILLKALARLPASLHWQFSHIGGGTELDQLKVLSKELGLDDRVTWLGPKNQSEVLEAYRRSDLFVLASRETEDKDRDGLPNVLVEAASQGVACIATEFSAIPELIDTEKSGLLVPADDAVALAGAMERGISQSDLRFRMGKNARERVLQDFDFLPAIHRLKVLFEREWHDRS